MLLFGLIVALLIRDWRTRGMRHTKLSLIAALLALGWNIGSLVVLGSPARGFPLIGIVVTASFSMLSLVPAVLLHVAAQGQQRLIVAAGYMVSGCAVLLHFNELFFSGVGLHQAGLILIVVGFGILTLAVFLSGQRRTGVSTRESEWISPACLLLFTTSFLHFGYQHTSSPWAAEIAWHHIGIPVALIVLLRDYRFLLLDTFLRFLVNSGLVTAYITAVLVLTQKFRLWDLIRSNMFFTGMSLISLCLSLIAFTYLRNAVQAWVSRAIFRRPSVEDCVKAIVNLASSVRSQEELLALAAEQAANHLRTDRCAIVAKLSDAVRTQDFHAEAQISLRFSSGDARC